MPTINMFSVFETKSIQKITAVTQISLDQEGAWPCWSCNAIPSTKLATWPTGNTTGYNAILFTITTVDNKMFNIIHSKINIFLDKQIDFLIKQKFKMSSVVSPKYA